MNRVLTVAYFAVICIVLIGFSIYDIRTRRVPNRALAAFSPIVLLCPFLPGAESLFHALIQSLFGAACGFGVLLTAALVSKDGSGIGGGDIKLAGLIGFVFGPYRIMAILLLATLLAAPVALIYTCKKKSRTFVNIGFVSFM